MPPTSARNTRSSRVRRVTFREHKSGEREQRDRRQRRRDTERIGFDEDRRGRDAVMQKQPRRQAAEDREQRHPEHGRGEDHHHTRPGGGAFDHRRRAHQHRRDNQPGCRAELVRPRGSGPPDQPHRDDRERDRQNALGDPGRDSRANRGLRLALGRDHLRATPGEYQRHARRHRRGNDPRDPADAIAANEGAGRKREQLAVAGGDGGAEKSDPQREVLDDRPRAGHADAEQTPDADFENRQDDHRQQRQRAHQVLDAGRGGVPHEPDYRRATSRGLPKSVSSTAARKAERPRRNPAPFAPSNRPTINRDSTRSTAPWTSSFSAIES